MAFHLKAASLDWALSHIERHGDTDIFPKLFEYEAMRYCWEPGLGYGEIKSRGLREILRATDLSSWALKPQRRSITPKNRFGFRIGTQLDPLDSVLFHALVYEIGSEIELARVPAVSNIVHSYRFKPTGDGDMFDRGFGYRTFVRAISEGVASENCNWVVTADIADFYPRVYSHPLENSLRVSVGSSDHVNAVLRFLSQLNQNVSYGLPVGPSGSRILAELVISDVDRLLMSEGFNLVRFVDDYRIFCRTEREAYDALAKLANALFDSHGLTLQQHKTRIYDKSAYLTALVPDEEDRERESLSREFDKIVDELGLDDPYEPIIYEDLPHDIKAKVDSLNLIGILREQIGLDVEASTLTIKFLLSRLSQLGNRDALDQLIAAPRILYLVLRSFSNYVDSISADGGAELGSKLINLLDDDVLGQLEFNRAWVIHPFTKERHLNCLAQLTRLLQSNPSQMERRELLLALGGHGGFDWIAANRRNLDQESPWCRRAFIAAARCLPGDQAAHWYKAIRPQLNVLEQAVSIWAESLPR